MNWRQVKKKVRKSFSAKSTVYKDLRSWLKKQDVCNNVYVQDDKVLAVAFKDNFVVYKEFSIE